MGSHNQAASLTQLSTHYTRATSQLEALAMATLSMVKDTPCLTNCLFEGPFFPFQTVYQLVQAFQILTQLPQSLVVHLSLTYLW